MRKRNRIPDGTITAPDMPSIPDWHHPRNVICAQNEDTSKDCTCAKPKKERNRKPYRQIKVVDDTVEYNVDERLTIQIYPNGRMVFRERGRKFTYETRAGRIYNGLVWRDAMLKLKEQKARKGKKKK